MKQKKELKIIKEFKKLQKEIEKERNIKNNGRKTPENIYKENG